MPFRVSNSKRNEGNEKITFDRFPWLGEIKRGEASKSFLDQTDTPVALTTGVVWFKSVRLPSSLSFRDTSFFVLFLFLHFATVLSQCNFSHRKFGLLPPPPPGKLAATESRYPTFGAYWMF